MSIWKRILGIFRSRTDRSADDVAELKATLDESYRSQLQLLQEVRRGVADVATSRKRVELQIAKLGQQGAAFADEARAAVQEGDDEAARRVLTRKIAIEQAVGDLETQHADIKADEDRLVDSSREIQSKIESFRIRKDSLRARHTAAEARTRINSAFTGISGEMGAVGEAIKQTEQRTRELEAHANAVDELVAEGIIEDVTNKNSTDPFDRQFDALSEKTNVDLELEVLKQELPGASGDGDGQNQV